MKGGQDAAQRVGEPRARSHGLGRAPPSARRSAKITARLTFEADGAFEIDQVTAVARDHLGPPEGSRRALSESHPREKEETDR